MKTKNLMLFILLTLIALNIKFFYTFNITSPDKYLKWLPNENHKRALEIIEKGSSKHANAWGPYYLFLSAQYKALKILGISNLIKASAIVNVFLSSLACGFVYLLYTKIFNQKIAVLSTLAYILYFPANYLLPQMLSENIFTLLLIMGIYFLILSRNNSLSTFISGLFLGLAATTRAILLPFFPLSIFWLYKYLKKNKFKKMLLYSIIFIIPLILAMFLNKKFSHQNKLQLSASTGVNFVFSQCKYKKISYNTENEHFWFSPPALWNSGNPELETDVPFHNNLHYLKMGAQCLINNPQNLYTNLDSITNIFHSILYPAIVVDRNYDYAKQVFKIFAIISFFSFVVYFLFYKKNKKHILLLYLLISLFLSVYLFSPGEERYLIPYVWIFFPFLIEIIDKLYQKVFA